jgi:hypothetical protein
LPDAGISALFSQKNSAWGMADLPMIGTNWSTTASQGMRHVLLTEDDPQSPAFLVMQRKFSDQPPYATTLTACRFSRKGALERLWSLSGLDCELQIVALEPALLHQPKSSDSVAAAFRVRLPRDARLALRAERAELRVVENRPLGITPSTPIAARLRPQEQVSVIVEGAAEQIFALQAPADLNSRGRRAEPRLLWSRPGRGMGDGSRWLGPLAVELDGRAGDEVVVANQDCFGKALLIAYRQDGSRLWQRRFEQTPGPVPVWNFGALTFWWPGHFRARDQNDLLVQTRRGLMHSDIGQLLDGRTGATIWRHEKAIIPGQFNWGYAGIPPGIADLDGDGLDELISLHPVCFWIADGKTGALKRGLDLAGRKQLPAWAAYGEPIVLRSPVPGQPANHILLDSPYILALLDTNGTPLWHGLGRSDYPTATNEGNVGQTTGTKHALIDCNGDGRFELASAGYGDGVRLIDPRDGKIFWSLPTPVPTCARVVAADIDGRPGDELLFVSGSKLIAVTGDLSAGRILWEWQGPADLSMPAIADLDGDKLAEILVQSADGTLHCLGKKR